jgi:ribosomal 50S subunit-recycling heat shock protein
MRLDKYLKVSRIIKRRTVANDACDAAHVTVNGRPAKASYDVKEGDVLEISSGQRTLKVRVLDVKEYTAKADAASLYEVIESSGKPPHILYKGTVCGGVFL